MSDDQRLARSPAELVFHLPQEEALLSVSPTGCTSPSLTVQTVNIGLRLTVSVSLDVFRRRYPVTTTTRSFSTTLSWSQELRGTSHLCIKFL